MVLLTLNAVGFHPCLAVFAFSEEDGGDVADAYSVASAFFFSGDDDEFVALAEGVGDVAAGHGEHALQVELGHGVDAVLDTLTGEFGEGFIDGDER